MHYIYCNKNHVSIAYTYYIISYKIYQIHVQVSINSYKYGILLRWY